MMRKLKAPLFIIIFISFIIVGGYYLYSINNIKFDEVKIIDGNIYLNESTTGKSKQLTFDGTFNKRGRKYASPLLADNKIIFIKCEDSVSIGDNNECGIFSMDIIKGDESLEYSLDTFDSIKSNSLGWTSNKNLILASKDRLYKYSNNHLEEIFRWNLLDLGIGGRFCDGIVFNDDHNFFTFCAASAIGTDVLGQMFLFNKDGELIETFKPVTTARTGIIDPVFENNTLEFFDTSESKQYTYDLNTQKFIN